MEKPIMQCGHAANAESNGRPVCAICVGVVSGWNKIVETPNLEGRIARCSYGPHKDVPSSTELAFFSHQPDKPFDRYYCGCFGWD